MATRRNVRKYKEPKEGIDAKFFFYIFTFGSIAFLGILLWLFGVDFGIFQFGGVATMAVAFWIFVVTLLIEYGVDVRYAVNIYQKFGMPTWLAFLPVVNCIGVWSKTTKIIVFSLLGGILIATLLIVTPIMIFISPAWITQMTNWSVGFIIVSVIGLFIVRGYQQAKLKVDLIKRYTQLVGMGATPTLGIFKSLLYFVPVIRVVLLLEDLTFINNVFDTIAKNKRVERGEL